MRALLLTDYRQLQVRDLPIPALDSAEILVRVKACGICGSDVHGYDGSSGRRVPPLVMGHEAAGVVAKVGAAAGPLRVGDRVTFDSTVHCGQCAYCRRGQINLCDRRTVLGVSCGDYRRHGALAEYVAVPRHIVHHLPADLAFEHAALIEPVAIAFHAVNRTPIRLGDSAVVIGAGVIGLLTVQALRLAGCGPLVAVDLVDERLALARQLGADEGLNARACDIPAAVADRTAGQGADHVVEAVGQPDAVATAIACARKGGTVTLVGNVAPAVELPLQSVVTRELTLIGSCASAGEYPACLEMMVRGAVRVEPLISTVTSLDDAPQWFERLYRRDAGVLKVVVQP